MPAAGVSGVDKPQILAFVIAKALSARRGVAIGRLDQIANKRNLLSYLFLTSPAKAGAQLRPARSEEHTSELQSLLRISYAVFCLKKNPTLPSTTHHTSYTPSHPFNTAHHTA